MNETTKHAARKRRITEVRLAANALRKAMLAVAENDVEFARVFATTIHNDIGWDQMIIDLEALAGLAEFEEEAP